MNSPAFAQPVRRPTREVRIGAIRIGAGRPIAVQSMCATKTGDVAATAASVNALAAAGADVVRIAVDTQADARALAEIRRQTQANLSVDLQENYRLAEAVAPFVDKIRYNPGHLYHHERHRPWADKVRYLVDIAAAHGCALRVGVNCGSVDPAKAHKYGPRDSDSPMLESALEHCALLDELGFTQYCVSLKDSDPAAVVRINRAFAAQRPDVPLHLGVTEAGMPPEGIRKTRAAFAPLLAEGIGDTLRVSLTVPANRKYEEIKAGQQIIADVYAGAVVVEDSAATENGGGALDIVSCPSCSRVENEAFIELAQQVREITRYAANIPLKIAVMGCRVNGPGETDSADLGLWCGPSFVNLKRRGTALGAFSYDEILPRLKQELDLLIAERSAR